MTTRLDPRSPAPRLARSRQWPEWSRVGENIAVSVACLVASVFAAAKVLQADRVQDDALVHQYWMRSFQDPQLFDDPLTRELRGSERYPEAYEALFRVMSDFADPVAFGEWLGVALMAVSGWLVFRVVREHTAWAPAAWLAAALFLALVDIHRFYGGFPRGLVHPAVLLTALLALRGRPLGAALVAGGAAFIYPPAALLAVGVLAISAIGWRDKRPRVDVGRVGWAALASVVFLAALVGPQLAGGEPPDVMTAAQARAYPEFNANGPLHFFVPSRVEYLKQNRSGFDLQASGSILLLAALALLAIRPANARHVRVEVFALAIVALALFTVAHLVLFKLYLPHRYTYPLLSFSAIVVGVTLRPTWQVLCSSRRPLLWSFALLLTPLILYFVAVYAFPLGPTKPLDALRDPAVIGATGAALGAAAGVALLLGRLGGRHKPAVGAVLTGLALLGAVLWHPGRPSGTHCPESPVTTYLRGLPKDAVVAGDPVGLNCIPLTARRPVVISMKLMPSYEKDYFRRSRTRMFDTLRAYYGPSVRRIADLDRRYGATHLWVRPSAVRAEVASPRGVVWKARRQPYGALVRRLVTTGSPAVLALPSSCRAWRAGDDEIYDIACLEAGRGTGRRCSTARFRRRG